MAALYMLCRAIVALTFFFAASWKLRNPVVFNAVVAAGVGGSTPRRFRALIWLIVAVLEILLGASLLISRLSWPPGVAAIGFLIVFSIFLLQAGSLTNGCGCWRPPQSGRTDATPYLVRNALLIMLLSIGTAGDSTLSIASEATLIAIAVLPALLLMEVPTVIALIRPARRPVTGKMSQS